MELKFSEASEKAIAEVVARYPERRACVMPTLDIAQRQFGYVSNDVMSLVATRLEVAPELVINTATFYTMYNKRPVGRYHIQVCRNVSCYLRGSDNVLGALERNLGIRVGETTEDGLFTLSTVECLASCGTAPALQVNETFHEEMTDEKVATLVKNLREEAK
jgi:NADH-quinone oxidoreductase E subunit